MKKILSGLVIIVLAFVILSCASSQPQTAAERESEEFTQEDVNDAFKEVYETYESLLILDGAKNYKVVNGDTPSKIALKIYGAGNGYYFPLFMLASSKVISDPDLIEAGMELIIPDLSKNLENQDIRQNIKSFLIDIAGIYEKKNTPWAPTIQKELTKLAQSL
jgi:hypothetical protein